MLTVVAAAGSGTVHGTATGALGFTVGVGVGAVTTTVCGTTTVCCATTVCRATTVCGTTIVSLTVTGVGVVQAAILLPIAMSAINTNNVLAVFILSSSKKLVFCSVDENCPRVSLAYHLLYEYVCGAR
jgi:hypothetical protein